MKITNIYKTTAALIFLMVAILAPLQEAWGQVTGDRYQSYFPFMKDTEITVENESGSQADAQFGVPAYIIDNERSEDTYWKAKNHEPITVIIQFPTACSVSGFELMQGGGEAGRASKIVMSYSNSQSTNENEIEYIEGKTFDNLDVTQRTQQLSFNSPVKGTHFKFVLTPNKNNQQATICLHEISFKPGELPTIKHKPAKWHDLRSSLNISQAAKDMDTFNDMILWDQIKFPGMENYQVQSAHTLIDTIYVHKGSSVRLNLPDRLNESTNMNSYQRWYSFRTDKTFEVNNPSYTGGIKDLLTPATISNYYRFNNGYVVYSDQNNVNKSYSMNFYFPTDDEFPSMFTGFKTTRDNNWYLVACDVSGYDDFTEHFDVSSNKSTFLPNAWEPTLTHRVIYYICAVDNDSNWYVQALKNQKEGEYLEDYVIHMPATRLPNKTNEMVALSKDARAYALPGITANEDVAGLTVRLDSNNTAGISLAAGNDSHTTSQESDREFTLTGETRKIHFLYPISNPDNTRSVKGNNTEATILVTKGEKNIARFRLVFTEENRLLTQSQVEQLDRQVNPGTGWNSLTYRTPNKLNTNPSYELLTELNFDYDPSVASLYGASQYYPFPMAWENSSYGFFDGGAADYISSRDKDYTEWGNYSILNNYLECGTWAWSQSKPSPDPLVNSKGTNSSYHLFVDASDRPGVIARLPFRENLCPGTELFVSAWVKSARYDTSADNAGMLFTIMGAETDENGQEKLTPIYRYQTGQIPATYQNDQSINLPGFVTDKNEWFQVYFSFVNSGNLSFDRYILQIDNNSASTSGGDMYLDDVRVYISKPTPHVSQKEFSCINKRTKMNFYLNWRQLCERLGMDENSTGDGTRAIDFCFVDTVKYTNAINAGEKPETALSLAIEHIGDGNDPASGGYDATIATIHFYENFNSHNVYNTQGDNLAKDNKIGDDYFFYRAGSGEDRKLSVDFYATLSPYRPYWMLIRDNNTGSVSTFSDFAASINDPCGIKSDFYVEPTALIKVNGEIVKPETDFCIGQIFNFTAQVRVPTGSDDEGNETYMLLDDVNFDWFFGTEDEFIAQNATYNNVSLNEALTQFREIEAYRDYESLDGVNPLGTFTQDHINIINYYLDAAGTAGGRHKRLVLCKPNLDISMLEGGLQVVMRPIKTTRPSGITEDQWANICWEYIPLALTSNHNAPVLHAGFNPVNYPTDDFNPNLRIGLAQIRKAIDEKNTLRIDLRKAELVSKGATYLGLITNRTAEENEVYQQIYLTATNDPQYTDLLLQHPGAFSLPIGRLTELFAKEYTGGSDFNDHANVYFYLNKQTLDDGTSFTFNPREGYEYTFSLHFEEYGEDVFNTCEGTFPLTMKVVPEYMEWVGQTQDGKYANWNNDDNWKRIKFDRIKKTNVTDDEKDYFTDGGTNDKSEGFVPMLFTKVIMPENSQVELYAAGYNADDSWGYGTGVSALPDHIAEPTNNIQYDLMAFDNTNGLTTERYRVSLLNQIHFEPGAEMLHAEYLLYDTAWVDYELTGGRWYTLASPLKAVYAGDFYTDKSGTEGNEYFQPIYYSESDNSRFNPSVYQRGWKGSNATMVGTPDGERAIAGNWSALYNKVDEAYTPGTGFSLKVQDVTGNATFRLPKADGSYKYYPYGDGQSGSETLVSRAEGGKDVSGRLRSDTLYIRKTDLTDAKPGAPIEITLSETAHGDYYLVGNPFMAHLDMEKFFDQTTGNGSVLEKKYWLVTNGNQTAAVGTGDGSWVAVDGNSTPTVAPLQSFFVQKVDNVTSDQIKFTQDMQTLGGTGDGLRSANALTITATTTDGRTSRAAVAYDMAASADYEVSEDAELFLDSNLGDVPMVYTVAGTMATSINRTSELYNIPLGVYGSKQEMVTLSFGGLNQFSSATLYDAQEQTETPLREGKTVSVPAGTSGRYFLRAGTPTGNEVIARNAFLVYSVGGGKVMVTSSNTPLKDIRVYTMGGAQVRSIQASGMQQEIYLNRGIYLITVSDQDGLQETRKVLVR